MASLTFYGGAGEIGGNKILLKDKDAKIFLDFGEPFNFGCEYFACTSVRVVHGMEVYFKLGLMPKIEGLYRKDMLELAPMKYKKPDIDAVFISHSHCDHINHVPFLDEGIPIYVGHGTLKIMEALQTIGRRNAISPEDNNFKTFKSGEVIRIKHLKVQPIHVDHSIPGAYGFIINTPKGNIAYTGDMRFHGPMARMSEDFVKKARQAKPIALICEGTRVDIADPVEFKSEEWVRDMIDETVKNTKGIVFGYFSSTNIDRLLSFFNAAVNNKRKFVIDCGVAEILESLKGRVKGIPDVLNDKNILVYYRMENRPKKYTQKYENKKVDSEYVNKHQDELVMMLSFYALIELIYIEPSKGASFVYSLSDIYWEGEDNEDTRQAVENWMKLFGLNMVHAHVSGHAARGEIEQMVKEINPKVLIPVHTQHPEAFKEFYKNVIIPEKGREINL